MRHGVRAGMPLGTLPCTMLASLGQITSFSKKNPNFLGNHSKFVGNAVKARACSSHGHAAKAKAAPMGTQPRPRQLPWARGTQPRPVHVAALASHGQEARSQGPMGTLPRPKRHAAKAQEARCQWARCQGPRGTLPMGTLPMGTLPRPRQPPVARSQGQGMQRRARQGRSPPWAHGFGRAWGG